MSDIQSFLLNFIFAVFFIFLTYGLFKDCVAIYDKNSRLFKFWSTRWPLMIVFIKIAGPILMISFLIKIVFIIINSYQLMMKLI
jgi:hypothetical protein